MEGRLACRKLHPDATLPARGSEHSAGLDLHALEAASIRPGEYVSVRTGLAVSVPRGFYGRVAPRSGLASRHGLDVLAGVIDSDYRGEVVCVLINHGAEEISLEKGARMAQLIIERVAMLEPEWADELSPTGRGTGGFGSTG